MTAHGSFLRLNRLRVDRQGSIAYDHSFHEGVNIVRGQNGSGKSTIADFIFFILGGEFDDWKGAAKRCDEVQAEVETPRGKLTLRRRMASAQEPISVFFGPMADAAISALDRWEQWSTRRRGGQESFSQVMFRSILIPEAQSEGAANVTMHQLLRLCYSDQRTPATRLFRFESFDTQSIREAVGDLVCGISGYEIYEIDLELREKQKQLDEVRAELTGLLKALPREDALRTPALIYSNIESLEHERLVLQEEIADVDRLVEPGRIREYLSERQVALSSLSAERNKLRELELKVDNLQFELREISDYLEYLQEAMEKLAFAEATLSAIGSIEFTHCPACGIELVSEIVEQHCVVCKSPLDMEREKGRYNQIRLDMEIQARESRQLTSQKESEIGTVRQELRLMRREHERSLSSFELRYGGGNGPREAFLATRTNRLGHIEAEIEFLTKNLETAEQIEFLAQRRDTLSVEIERLNARKSILQEDAKQRRAVALSEMSDVCAGILRADLRRQPEFVSARLVDFDFRNDSISVDGLVNFAESSNVYLKNAAILGLFLAAGEDSEFYHPRFLLIDNIEDKGMEVERSHLFQRIIVERVTELHGPYQVIFTTSMMNPELELEEYTVGPAYTSHNRTLAFG